jgi:ABC-type nitrate/sulfonate/bicarbonate transport system substrate-binding protein
MSFMKFAAATFVAVALVQPAAAQQEDVTLALPATNLGFAPAYVAAAKGFWPGLNVKMPVISGIGAMNAVLSGSADFCVSSGLTIVRANIRGQKVVQIVNTMDGMIVELVVRKAIADAAGITIDSPIQKRAAVLKGKKIAVGGTPNALPHGYLRLFGKKGGIDPERDVQIAVMQPDAAHAAMKSGQIDGFAETLPQPISAIKDGSGALLSSGIRYGVGDKGDFPELAPMALNGVMTRPDYCDKKGSVCERFVAGIVQAMNFLHDNPKESIEILHKAIPGMEPEVFEEAFQLTIKWMPRKGESDEGRFAKAQEVMITAGMIKPEEKLASFKDIYTNKFIK